MLSCSELITGTDGFGFNSVDLKYNLVLYGDAVLPDLGELAVAHGIVATEKSGSIQWLNRIVMNEEQYEESRKPQIKVTLSGTSCTGAVTVVMHKDSVSGNFLFGVPQFLWGIGEVKVEIKTIKTNAHDLQLIWASSANLTDLRLSDSGDINTTLLSITGQGIPVGTVSVRRKDGQNIYETDIAGMYEDFNPEYFYVDLSTESEVSCSALEKGIIIGDKLDLDKEWDSPLQYKIDGETDSSDLND